MACVVCGHYQPGIGGGKECPTCGTDYCQKCWEKWIRGDDNICPWCYEEGIVGWEDLMEVFTVKEVTAVVK